MKEIPDFLKDNKNNENHSGGGKKSRGRSRRKNPEQHKSPVRYILVFLLLAACISGACIFFFRPDAVSRIADSFTGFASGIFGASVYDDSDSPSASPDDGTADAASDTANTNTDASQPDSGASDNSGTGSDSSPADDDGDGVPDSGEDTSGKYTDLLNDPERMAAENCYPLDDGGDGVITLRFAGDVLLDDSYAIAAYQRELSGGYIIAENAFDDTMLSLMRGADIFMLNNEFTYTLRGEPTPEKQFTFRAFPADVSLLNDIGTDIVTLANNHAYDYGEISLIDSMDTLKNAGIAYAGAGRNIDEASSPVYFVNDDVRIAIIASTQIERMPNPDTKGATADAPGVFRSMDLAELTAAINEAKEVSDYVIVFTHWGTEGAAEPDWSQNEQAPLIAEAGADLIIGAHPQELQKIAWQGYTPVFYSLGNYLFNSKTLDTCLAEINLDSSDGSLLSVRFIPALQSGCRVTSYEGEEYAAALERMRALSPEVNIDDEGYVMPK